MSKSGRQPRTRVTVCGVYAPNARSGSRGSRLVATRMGVKDTTQLARRVIVLIRLIGGSIHIIGRSIVYTSSNERRRHTTHQRSRLTICKGGMASVTRTLVRCAVSKSTVVRFVEHAFRIRLAAVRKPLSWITTMRPTLCVGCSVTDATSAWAVFTTMPCS